MGHDKNINNHLRKLPRRLLLFIEFEAVLYRKFIEACCCQKDKIMLQATTTVGFYGEL
jgi:hypothetical protein